MPQALMMKETDEITLDEFNMMFKEQVEKPKIDVTEMKKKTRER